MTPLPIVRASSMPLASSCPASLSGEGVQVDSYDPTATDGVEVHRAIAVALRGKGTPPFEGVNAGENEDMVALALAYVTNLGMSNKSYTEIHLEAPPFSATLDVLWIDVGTMATVIDWKTCHREDDHEAQIIAQCACVFGSYDDIDAIDAHVVYLRNEGALRKRYTRHWVEQWAAEFIHNTLEHPEIYRPGEWCWRCRRKVQCPALAAQNRQTAILLADSEFAGTLSRSIVPDLRPKVKLLKEVIDRFDAYVRDEVLNNGPILLGNGKELRPLEMTLDKIGILKAWEILTARFTDQELAGFVDVKKTAMTKLIEASAPKGGKSKASATFMDRLRAAWAVTTTVQTQVREMNIRM